MRNRGNNACHSERSEESQIRREGRGFTIIIIKTRLTRDPSDFVLRMTEGTFRMTNNKMNKKNNIINLKTAEKEGKKKKILKITVEWIIYVLIFVAIVWGTPKALTKILNTSYPIASITSSSMWPVLKQGDIVLIKGVSNKENIKVGDIVVYTNEKGFTIHRVVRLNDKTLVTKGDANNVEDQPVAYDKLVGKTIEWRGKPWRVPYLGKLSQIFR